MELLALSPGDLVVASVWNDVLVYGFRTLFFLSAILLMVIVLLQEGKGGGLASALGGQGAETFGVSSGGVNKVTLTLAGLFLISGLAHALAFRQSVTEDLTKGARKPAVEVPLDDGDELPGDALPGGSGGGTPPLPGEKEGTGEKKPADKPADKPAEKPADKPAEGAGDPVKTPPVDDGQDR